MIDNSYETPNERDVISSAALPGGIGTAVVYGWKERNSRRLENLELLSQDGAAIWRAKLPAATGIDCFVAVMWDVDCLRANTWSGWAVWLNPTTGETLRTSFVK